jgi:hypothetical protein
MLLSSILVADGQHNFESLEELAAAIEQGNMRLTLPSTGSAYYRDIETHNSETMQQMREVGRN